MFWKFEKSEERQYGVIFNWLKSVRTFSKYFGIWSTQTFRYGIKSSFRIFLFLSNTKVLYCVKIIFLFFHHNFFLVKNTILTLYLNFFLNASPIYKILNVRFFKYSEIDIVIVCVNVLTETHTIISFSNRRCFSEFT